MSNRIPELSPRGASERWLKKMRVDKRESTVSAYSYQIKHFVEWTESVDISSIGEVSGWDIESYETYRRDQGVKSITLNKELGTLRNFLRYCARIELIDGSIPEKVDPPTVPHQADVDKTLLKSERARDLLNYHSSNQYGSRSHVLLALEWYTGARLNSLRGLNVGDYYPEKQYVEFLHRPDADLPLKNGRAGERAVGFPESVSDILDEYMSVNRIEKYDNHGSRPLITSEVGRASRNAIRTWTYFATSPCLRMECPHGKRRNTCEYTDYSKASQCPSSRSPHQVRTGTITWQLNQGIPVEKVAKRVNTSVSVLKKHYDHPTRLEDLEKRRRQHLDQLSFERDEGDCK